MRPKSRNSLSRLVTSWTNGQGKSNPEVLAVDRRPISVHAPAPLKRTEIWALHILSVVIGIRLPRSHQKKVLTLWTYLLPGLSQSSQRLLMLFELPNESNLLIGATKHEKRFDFIMMRKWGEKEGKEKPLKRKEELQLLQRWGIINSTGLPGQML